MIKKIILAILVMASILAKGQVNWTQTGNTLFQRVVGGNLEYRFNKGPAGFWNITDSIRSRAPQIGGMGYIQNQSSTTQSATFRIGNPNDYIWTDGGSGLKFTSIGGSVTNSIDGYSSGLKFNSSGSPFYFYQGSTEWGQVNSNGFSVPSSKGFYISNTDTKIVSGGGGSVLQGIVTIQDNGLLNVYGSNGGAIRSTDANTTNFTSIRTNGNTFSFTSSEGVSNYNFDKNVTTTSLTLSSTPSAGSTSDGILTRSTPGGQVRFLPFSAFTTDLSNYVTLNGNQTISGQKTFTNTTYFPSLLSTTDPASNNIVVANSIDGALKKFPIASLPVPTLQQVTAAGNTTTTGAKFGGNVGIGNTNPLEMLVVSGDNGVSNLEFNASNGPTYGNFIQSFNRSNNTTQRLSFLASKASFFSSVEANANDGNSNTLVRNQDLAAVSVVPQQTTGTSQSMSPNILYVPTSSSLTTYSLPTSATFGQRFQVVGDGTGGFRIAQNAGQQIVGVNASTTSGTTGYLQSTNSNCAIFLIAISSTRFKITNQQGTFTVN